ncbi:MAG: class I SAM-dependent methyltransferase [Clostridia bacterium]|nr:class I SAM-dependent methyltransferase [Clostridia bacterium]
MYSGDAVFYDAFQSFCGIGADVELIRRLIPDSARDVCEIACGTGRILLSLRRPGLTLTGLDLSEDMLKVARKKDPSVRWLQADMQCLPDLGPFDFIICGYNSIQHVMENAGVRSFLRGARENLREGGLLYLDLYNPREWLKREEDPYAAEYTPGGRLSEPLDDDATMRFRVPPFLCGEQAIVLYESQWTDEANMIRHITYEYYEMDRDVYDRGDLRYLYTQKQHPEVERFLLAENYEMREFLPGEMEEMILDCGFQIEKRFGEYDGSDYARNSTKQIYLLRRAQQKA